MMHALALRRLREQEERVSTEIEQCKTQRTNMHKDLRRWGLSATDRSACVCARLLRASSWLQFARSCLLENHDHNEWKARMMRLLAAGIEAEEQG
eukprot:6178775-Pleurochrysis_carterae.AAC.1